jgi:hypothetical protein
MPWKIIHMKTTKGKIGKLLKFIIDKIPFFASNNFIIAPKMLV